MSRYLDEIYCTAVRESGSHGTWEPGSWLWPGVTGLFRHGIFERLGFLKPEDWNYTVFAVESGPELVETEGIRLADFGAGASVKDPLGALVSAEAKLSYEVEGADEVLVLTRPGRWWEIDDIEGLLARIQAVLEEWPLTKTVICATFETTK